MTSRTHIIANPATVGMLEVLPLLNHDMVDDMGIETISTISHQIRAGCAILLMAYQYGGFVSAPIALLGLYPDTVDEASLWFYPTKYIKQYTFPLIRQGPDYIRGLIMISGIKKVNTLIDPKNEKFKKFAKLAGFDYSSSLDLDGIAFEEWKFGG